MRSGGGRTTSRGSLRSKHEGKARSVKGSRLRSGSGAKGEGQSRRARGVSAVSPHKKGASTAVAVASVSSSPKNKSAIAKKSNAAVKPRRKRLERYVPEQRHLFGSDRVVKLPCPETKR